MCLLDESQFFIFFILTKLNRNIYWLVILQPAEGLHIEQAASYQWPLAQG